MDKQVLDLLMRILPLPTEYRTRDSRAALAERLRDSLHPERANARREVLAMQGVIPTKIFLLAEGLGMGQYYGEYHLFPHAPYLFAAPAIMTDFRAFHKCREARFSIEVYARARVFSISRSAIAQLEQAFPKLEASFRLLSKQQNEQLKAYAEGCRKLMAVERYSTCLERLGPSLDAYLQKDVAAHVGVAAETFNRMLKRSLS